MKKWLILTAIISSGILIGFLGRKKYNKLFKIEPTKNNDEEIWHDMTVWPRLTRKK